MANPTTKRSRKVESEADAKNQALIQQLNELEHIWKSQEKSRLRRSSSSSSSSSTTTSFDHLFQNSPRSLMSHLQHREPALRARNCSDEVEEILMDRRDAIVTGRFKGRQLFAAAEEESVWRGGERRRRESCDSSESCSLPEEKRVVEVAVVDGRPEEKGGCRRVASASLGLVLIVLALVLFCISCNGNNVEDLILVPT
ncbi:hypothetical protein AAHA92_25979 [Salvia divinorum]|uniref:Uncharacterized protein n=1 Tax=Salvia divinorum TaxID=28513 RepID=A0ABD1GCF4_SALDI